ncbi:uncharacterized protein EAE97_003577 [Botrytis byssoidea]|uniref:Uncharacterized protein n=1 Tax=Botrytis byssoidea TaxID=139641 RepID=A0A9P5M153_9HELO|nr:uncharacterized protein EAE97_003577 [Botrytis byssoidea]KAF7948166.1 hypothetical protein EAE97_003577 [Botrytis byssoidea]
MQNGRWEAHRRVSIIHHRKHGRPAPKRLNPQPNTSRKRTQSKEEEPELQIRADSSISSKKK